MQADIGKSVLQTNKGQPKYKIYKTLNFTYFKEINNNRNKKEENRKRQDVTTCFGNVYPEQTNKKGKDKTPKITKNEKSNKITLN